MGLVMPSLTKGTHAFQPSQQGVGGGNGQDQMGGHGDLFLDGVSPQREVEMDVNGDGWLTRHSN